MAAGGSATVMKQPLTMKIACVLLLANAVPKFLDLTYLQPYLVELQQK